MKMKPLLILFNACETESSKSMRYKVVKYMFEISKFTIGNLKQQMQQFLNTLDPSFLDEALKSKEANANLSTFISNVLLKISTQQSHQPVVDSLSEDMFASNHQGTFHGNTMIEPTLTTMPSSPIQPHQVILGVPKKKSSATNGYLDDL